MKSVNFSVMIAVITFALTACSKSETTSVAASVGTTPSPVKPARNLVTINGGDFSYALFAGKDDNGKTKEQYQLEVQDARVRVTNSFVYGKDTSSESSWKLLIGDNTPRIVCEQTSKEAKMVVANMENKMNSATVEGDYARFSGDVLYLSNCTIQ